MIALVLALALSSGPQAEGAATEVRRDPPRIHRSQSALRAFAREHPCPASCATYKKSGASFVLYRRCGACQIDHVCALKCGGADAPPNMQWLTSEANREKGADCSACRPELLRSTP